MILKGMKNSATEKSSIRENSEEDDLRLFIGTNVEKFMDVYYKKLEKKSVYSWNWAAFLVPYVWFLYRKMWYIVAILIIVPIALSFVFIDSPSGAGIGISLVFSLMSKMFYLSLAEYKIKKINARNLPEEERLMAIKKAGGTSVIGAIFGTVLTILFFGIALLAIFYPV